MSKVQSMDSKLTYIAFLFATGTLAFIYKTVNGGTIGLDDCQRIFPIIHKIFVK